MMKTLLLILLFLAMGVSVSAVDNKYLCIVDPEACKNPPQTQQITPSTQDQWSGVSEDIIAINAMKQGTFESTAEFEQRRHSAIENLETKTIQAAQKQDTAYQAGTLTMTAYDPDAEILTADLAWQKNVSALLSGTNVNTMQFPMPRAAAQQAFGQSKTQPFLPR